MKSCPKCNNFAQDDALSCDHCGMVLDRSLIARASGGGKRISTITEFSDATNAAPSPRIEYRPTPPPPLSPASFQPSTSQVTIQPPGPAAPSTPSGRRGQTILMNPGGYEATGVQPVSTPLARRLIAVLVTYSWKPEGQVFPIREGRNLIGRGEECDVRLTDDPTLSLVNSHITFRQSFTLGDMVSMGGTYVNGEPVEEQFRPLNNLSTLRLGSTQLLFVVVDPKLIGETN